MKKITQEDIKKAWDNVRKAWEAWDKARDKAWELERKFREQEELKKNEK